MACNSLSFSHFHAFGLGKFNEYLLLIGTLQ